jgi:hypothetical protein
LIHFFLPAFDQDFSPPKSGKRPFVPDNVLLKVQATDRAKLMLMALEAGMGQADRPS